jgi:hypothetical protein
MQIGCKNIDLLNVPGCFVYRVPALDTVLCYTKPCIRVHLQHSSTLFRNVGVILTTRCLQVNSPNLSLYLHTVQLRVMSSHLLGLM